MRACFYLHVALWSASFAIFFASSIPSVGRPVLENKIGPVNPNRSTDSYLEGLTRVRDSDLFLQLVETLPREKQSRAVYASILALIPWIKSEGAILWAVLALLGLIGGLVRHRIRLFNIVALPGLLLVFSCRVYLKIRHCVPPSDFAWPTFKSFSANISRVTTIFRIALVELTDLGLWSIFWFIVFVAMIYLSTARSFARLLFVISILGPIALYLLTYIFGAWSSYAAHITSSLPRLFLQIVPVGWLAIALALSRPRAEPANLESNFG